MSDSDDFSIIDDSSSSSSYSDSQCRGSSLSRLPVKRPQLTANISDTKYPVIHHVLRNTLGWRLTHNAESANFDLWWTDSAVEPEKLAKMQLYQKINHFPGMYALSKKNFLARNLTKLRKVHPDDYSFFPLTWVLPSDFADLKSYSLKNPNLTYIVKPEALSQGKGIFLTKDVDELSPIEHFIVQRYVEKPFLIEGLKFDLRVYVLVAGCDPLRVFVHEEGLTRLATEEYERPDEDNLGDVCMHLTNYAVNKFNPNFVFNEDSEDDDIGHKRSLSSTFRLLSSLGHDIPLLQSRISDIIIKTLCAVQPSISHYYHSCQPEDVNNGMCFELLGFDILLDSKGKPWLLEVNHSPSFTTDTPLDEKVKRKVIGDTIELLNFSAKKRKQCIAQTKNEIQQRTWMGKSAKLSREEREEAWERAQRKRDEWELGHLGGFTKVFPVEGKEKYDPFLQTATTQWEDWTGGNISRLKPLAPKREDAWLKLSKQPSKTRKPNLSFQQSSPDSGVNMNSEIRPRSATPNKLKFQSSSLDGKLTNVFERLSKVRASRQDLLIHPSTLPNIYFSEAVSQALSYIPPTKAPSELSLKGPPCFPQHTTLQNLAKRKEKEQKFTAYLERVMKPVGKVHAFMLNKVKSPKNRYKSVLGKLYVGRKWNTGLQKKLM